MPDRTERVDAGDQWAWSRVRAVIPGLLLVMAVGITSRTVALGLPPAISEITVSVVIGLLLRNLLPLPPSISSGVRFASVRLLRLGIVLLGAKLSFGAVLDTGIGAVLMILVCASTALLMTMLLGRVLGLPARLTTLIAVGTAICGNSAIVATAPVIEAKGRDVSLAVGTITLFGVAAVLAFPLIGHALGLSNAVLGHWAGVAINDTSQVTAAGFAYSDPAGVIATVVKLTRNTLIGPVVIGIGLLYRRQESGAGSSASAPSMLQVVPLFVVGFLLLAVANSIGIIPADIGAALSEASKLLVLLALAGIGLGTDFRSIRETGASPLLMGLAVAVSVAALGLALAAAFPG
jgi:uncharacterized integral membrane protein (TIGR00698 family)